MARKTKQEAQEARQRILGVALRLFSQQGVSSTSLGEATKVAGATRGTIYWRFEDRSDLFSEIQELLKSNIGELELEYQIKSPGDPFSVLREILVHVLESMVTEEQRRLLTETIFRRCEFAEETAVIQQAQRNLCLESYDCIEQTLRHRIEARMLSVDLMARRAAIIVRGCISGLMENRLFTSQPSGLRKETRDYIAVLLEMYLLHFTLRNPVTNE